MQVDNHSNNTKRKGHRMKPREIAARCSDHVIIPPLSEASLVQPGFAVGHCAAVDGRTIASFIRSRRRTPRVLPHFMTRRYAFEHVCPIEGCQQNSSLCFSVTISTLLVKHLQLRQIPVRLHSPKCEYRTALHCFSLQHR